jgi:hypothetical protein
MDLFRRDERKIGKTCFLKDGAMMGSQQCHGLSAFYGYWQISNAAYKMCCDPRNSLKSLNRLDGSSFQRRRN